MSALKHNKEFQRDLVYQRDKLKKSFQWTASSQILSNLPSKGVNNGKGLEYQHKAQSSRSQVNEFQNIEIKAYKKLCTNYGSD